ncbi:hypothetical protein HYFRA_00013923 [Hymenoscyphus fraxineus]|uniref:Uncharacterized protein n=1 Tax=Hymenoscyphus fraxineus TaxID=746836 RepID=A0A9N9LC18_9HELO|nr:hypothetical protein HYFRA_00013923 [Hymenoscyphus fraxineus]
MVKDILTVRPGKIKAWSVRHRMTPTSDLLHGNNIMWLHLIPIIFGAGIHTGAIEMEVPGAHIGPECGQERGEERQVMQLGGMPGDRAKAIED